MGIGPLLEQAQIVSVIDVLDLDTDRTGDWISLANYSRICFVFAKGAGTAGDDWNLNTQQASDNAGTGAKDLDAIDYYYIKEHATALSSVAQFTRTTQTADAAINGDATSAEDYALVVWEINAEDLDVDNGFDHVNVTATLDASGGAQYGTVIGILLDPRYPQRTALGAL